MMHSIGSIEAAVHRVMFVIGDTESSLIDTVNVDFDTVN